MVKMFSLRELAERDECLIAVDGHVLDVTRFKVITSCVVLTVVDTSSGRREGS